MPGRIVGRTRGRRRQARLHADAAGARAAHPPLQGHLQHLHQSGPGGHRRHDPYGAARARRAWSAWRSPATRICSTLLDRLKVRPVYRAAFSAPVFHETVLSLRVRRCRCARPAAQQGHPGRPRSAPPTIPNSATPAGLHHRDQDRGRSRPLCAQHWLRRLLLRLRLPPAPSLPSSHSSTTGEPNGELSRSKAIPSASPVSCRARARPRPTSP